MQMQFYNAILRLIFHWWEPVTEPELDLEPVF